jgi:hypothetical protein
MMRGLLVPLSPEQEIVLRRIAHGSLTVDSQVVAKLRQLALIERTSSGYRLSPLGRLHYDALPKAPLLMRPRSIHTVTGYIEGVIEKAQSRGRTKLPEHGIHADASPRPILLDSDDEDKEGLDDVPARSWFAGEHFRSSARTALHKIRRCMKQSEQRQIHLLDASRRRIARSRSLLEQTAPIRPTWLIALQ